MNKNESEKWEVVVRGRSAETNNAHFKCPNPSNPDFELSLDPFYSIQLNAFPPAPPGGLPPKEE